MKDDFGQSRVSVTTREVVIAALFVALAAVGTWTVAWPALDQDAAKQAEVAKSDTAR